MALPGLLLNFGLKHLFDTGSKQAEDWLDSRFEDSSRAVVGVVIAANRRAWDVIALSLAVLLYRENGETPILWWLGAASALARPSSAR